MRETAELLKRRHPGIAAQESDYLTVVWGATTLATILVESGDEAAAAATLEPYLDLADDPVVRAWLASAASRLALWRDDASGAAAWFERAGWSPTADYARLPVVRAAPLYVAALRRTGRVGDAATVVGRVLDAAARFDLPEVHAAALTERAHLLTAAGRASQALDLHHEALAVRVGHGLWWSGRRQPGRRRRRLDEAAAFAQRSRGRRDRPEGGWDSLTPTELSVVRLVVEGRTNPEIGARLFISRSTVKAHLSRDYSKLRVTNRTELATVATGHLTDET